MREYYVYHVVTDKPMEVGQQIVFDEHHHSGVYERVMCKMEIVEDIYQHPENYRAEDLEHHVRVALRELALENVRKKEFSQYPSRMNCLYVSETMEEAEKWAELFVGWGRPTYSIVKLKVNGSVFIGDANNCFDAQLDEKTNIALARHYWKNLANVQGEAIIKEILVNGNIEVVEIMKVINENL